ncbi:MAG: DUF3006 domain-containing protein [Clostridiales bacterium]|jgi:hypothetical protein|nr:DUF3006 domain-containing protein [Clostridiales bacterium]HOJ35435.1 DUF3006 domain-containing protein [Clostridiales bacterium]HPP67517.1 DUF3006 domain-containing protein [Clostridiales bacterium]HPU66909.1 DUF3006 domain-containing protein [Clostridiales bacterium]HQD72906.1 DUF3006 domain-containing protein [Clostridiales bacterium]
MYIIDRFEGSIAVIEDDDGKMIEVNRSLLPKNAKEGSVLIKNDDGSFSVDEKMTAERRRKLKAMQDALFGN